MKSLEKDRNRRYDTATGLARDVERYLKDEMVEARPPSLAYRLRKSIRKNRGPVIAVSLVLGVLIGGVMGTTLAMFQPAPATPKRKLAARDVIQANLLITEALKDDAIKGASGRAEEYAGAQSEP